MKKTSFFPCFLSMFFVFCLLVVSCPVFAQDQVPEAVAGPDLSGKTSSELVKMAWAASNRSAYEELKFINLQMQKDFEQQALSQNALLSGFPERERINDFQVMNDFAVVAFVYAEALMHSGKTEEAIKAFEALIQQYPYAQAWDPSRGGYWSVAEKSHASVRAMQGLDEESQDTLSNVIETVPVLARKGKARVVDYSRLGTFSGIGTKEYNYRMHSLSDLAEAVGEGIYPNTTDVYKNPRFKALFKEGRQEGSYWEYVNTKDLEAAYFKWAAAAENPGVKLFYTGLIFEKAKMYLQAIKAYHALVVHFPSSSGVTYWHTPWYPAQAAVAKIKNILRQNPGLGLVYKDAKVRVHNGNDSDTSNDVFVVWPGVIQKGDAGKIKRIPAPAVRLTRGGKKVNFVQYNNGHWQMQVEGKPFMIKGITYAPTKIGQSPDKGTLANWMFEDTNGNGKPDGPYDSWVDRNRNGIQDSNEPVVGDFQLLKEMGANALRIYHNGNQINRELLRELHAKYGIYVAMGDFLGKYTLGSGAEWAVGADYENPVHLARMMESVEKMVTEFKDEPFILMWILGNENNYGVGCNADKKPEKYYQFVNEVAKRIKELDPDHPVGIANGDAQFLELFSQLAPDVDVFGANVYRGDYGFGSLWDDVRVLADRPAFISEYGAPAHSRGTAWDRAEKDQADYHRGNWMDIEANSALSSEGEGNAVGGFAFEWADEWWKNYEPMKHDTKADVIGPFAGGFYYEEWFGLTGQGNGQHSPFLRELRESYFTYQRMWKK